VKINIGCFLCSAIIVSLPASLMAADAGVAMARPYGTAWLNGAATEQASTIFPGDLVQTNGNSAINIRSAGSSVTVLSDSLVKFEGGAVSVEHGRVKLVTSKGMSASAGSVTVAPASNAWTEFEMTDVAGKVQIVALKGDLQISNGSQTTTLAQGQQATQKDSTEAQAKQGQSAMNASAGYVGKSAFTLGAAGAAAEAMNRDFDSAATRGVDVVHSNLVKTISPVR
jgi:hypothetical protein